jgi:hypothetical protein
MKLTQSDKDELIQLFPKITFCFEKKVYKTIFPFEKIVLQNKNTNSSAQLYMAIPCGKKSFIWFLNYKDNNLCINYFPNTNKMKLISCSFGDNLTYGLGTILYGTFFINKNTNYFATEDIFYYSNKNITYLPFIDKLELFYYMFNNDIKQISYTTNDIVIAMPLLSSNYDNLMLQIKLIPYPINYVYLRDKCIIYKHKYYKYSNKGDLHFFNINSTVKNDIYEIYDFNNKFIDIAYIPDYNTSILMNSLFKNYSSSHNSNLDLIEESDDEEDVFIYKQIKMQCIYNTKFKKYIPIYYDKNI